jgi:ribosomal protein L17
MWDHDPWVLLSKSICEDSKIHTDMVKNDQRNRYVSKLIKLRQQQTMLKRETEKQRIIEEEKVAA